MIFEAIIRPPGCLCELSKLYLLYRSWQKNARDSIKIHAIQHPSLMESQIFNDSSFCTFYLGKSSFCGCRNFPGFFGETAPVCCVFFPVCLCYTMVTKHRLPGNLPNCTYTAHKKSPVKMKKEVEAILKRFSAKLRQQEQAYRSLHDAARSLLSPKGRVFLLFLLFYKVLTNLLLVPAVIKVDSTLKKSAAGRS